MDVQIKLGDPKRKTTRGGKARHLLSLIAVCHVCGGWLHATSRNRPEGHYQCQSGRHVKVYQDELDAEGEAAILGYLQRPDVYEDYTAGQETADAELTNVRARLADARGELRELEAAVGEGLMNVASAARIEPMIVRRITALEDEEKSLATPTELRGLILLGADVADRWAVLPIEARRAVARFVFVPERVGQLRVTPRTASHPAATHQPAGERIIWRRNSMKFWDNPVPHPPNTTSKATKRRTRKDRRGLNENG